MRADGSRAAPGLVRVAVVDDHAAVRTGLETAIDDEPDLLAVGAAESAEEARPSSTAPVRMWCCSTSSCPE